MIVRDEASMLSACLDSVAGLVDEIVLVDTGSVDDTVSIAERHGARVVHRVWDDDFSAPRNRALELATGDWVLILDADERLAPGAAAVLRAACEREDFECGMLPLHNAASLDADPVAVVRGSARIAEVAYLPRLLRRTDDLRYTGIVHENVGLWLAQGRRIAMLTGADIVHLGGVPSVRERRDKAARNIKLLKRYVAGAPHDVTPYGYLAHEHHEAGDVDAARAVSTTGWRLVEAGTAAPDLSVLRLATAHAWLMLTSGHMQIAIEVCERALAAMPRHPDLYFLRGCAHEAAALRARERAVRRTRLLSAADDYQRALDRRDGLVLQIFVNGCTGFAGETRLATVRLLLGDSEGAAQGYARSLAIFVTPEAQWGNAECLISVGKPREALAVLKRNLDERPDGWVLGALAAEAAGMLEQMMAMVARAQSVLDAGFVAPHRRERYADALALASMYSGKPAPLPGPLGQVAALMAGELGEGERARARPLDEPALARVVRHVMAHGSAAHADALRAPAATMRCPALAAIMGELRA